MKRKFDHGDEAAENLALEVLAWLAGDEERLFPFLQLSGLNPDTVRESARDPAFLGAVLDHVMGDEPMLLACARALDVKPERIAAAWRRLQPPEFDHDL
ncbi:MULTISPECIES: DUF3572 domain-containing protein [Methylobacterium]|uniref:DUF3572 domain-containing protein n=1 Tax=Methylobacterium thuringiense TaxID=1003091 RepID=A0ABQ4TGS7_9HYPH|nr:MULTISPECIES: DUF3572 domain-containing protein [Methylobacterium]TXN24474.1 DUF3572 family protein [Methylobacterium sp. WL9]GJE54403.1 hypothetical protein EKPJFOCH_0878 [Methylobacterium thuringiense]